MKKMDSALKETTEGIPEYQTDKILYKDYYFNVMEETITKWQTLSSIKFNKIKPYEQHH